jgi:hypothetical protein
MRRLGGLLRRAADRVDSAGALTETPWSFTLEDHIGVVLNQDGKGCPVLVSGPRDYQRAIDEHRIPAGSLDAVEWVTVGVRAEPGRVMVLGSADILQDPVWSRQQRGLDLYAPGVLAPGQARVARIPRWAIILKCEMRTFVQVFDRDYPSALKAMFDRGGRPG